MLAGLLPGSEALPPAPLPAASGVMNPLWDSPLPDLRGLGLSALGYDGEINVYFEGIARTYKSAAGRTIVLHAKIPHL